MKSVQGTPKNLNQAVIKALQNKGLAPVQDIVDEVEATVRDFISQKFCTEMLRDEACSDKLQDVFHKIVDKDVK